MTRKLRFRSMSLLGPVIAGLVAFVLATTLHAQSPETRALGRVQANDLMEISGLAYSRKNPGTIWVHDDGPIRDVYALRTNGQTITEVRLPEKLVDVEDIAIGPGPEPGSDYLYVGDIGDNDSTRDSIRVLRFREPNLSSAVAERIEVSDVDQFRLAYPTKPHDAEALLVDADTGDLLIVTKHKSNTLVFAARQQRLSVQQPIRLEEVCPLTVDSVSGGDLSRDGRRLVLRREEVGWVWERSAGESLITSLARVPQRIVVRGAQQSANGEAIAFHSSGLAYVTVSEGKHEWIYAFRLR